MVQETGEDRDRQLETYKAQRDRLDSFESTISDTGKERADINHETIAKLEREISQLEEMIAQLEVEFGKA